MSNNKIENNISKLLELEGTNCKKIVTDLESYVKDNLSNREIEEVLDNLIDDLRDYYMHNNSKMYEFNDEIDSEITTKISEVVKKTLVIYDSFAIVRKMELQEADKLLDEVFENCILRRDLDYINKKSEKNSGIKLSELKQLINAFSSMIYDCISKLLSETSIKKSLEVNTDLNPILVNSVAQNINSNFFELKLNYIINDMRNQKGR